MKHGDRNTNFFHNFATKRKKQNTLKGLVDDNGVRHEDRGAMCDLVHKYFVELFSSEVGKPAVDSLVDVRRLVMDDMNNGLLAPFTAEEVWDALFKIGDLKAPGPNVLHAVFYKRFWDMLGDDLIKEVLQVTNTSLVTIGWNNTTIVMISRVENLHKVS